MAAATSSPSLKRLDVRDPAALFQTHGAEEIRGLERQVRAEIEHKKEELRQMVGERYRDLIEAADTIGQMRRCAEGLVDAVRATDQYCARLRQVGLAAAPAPAPQVLIHGFTQSLLLDDAGSVLAMATSWDELEIQEETESGSSVTSTIRLPTQPSWYVQSFLFSLCQEINRVGGQALLKVTLQEMLKSCLVQVVAAYEKLSEEKQIKKEGAFPMTQNRALQLLYDLRYLSIVLTTKVEEKTSRSKPDSRIEKVTDYLEALIDPFDLDVFTPHLNSNLNRLVQRTSVLFGLVTGTENQFTPRTNTFNSQEPHNTLPLASSQIRFGLLPLSMTSTKKAKSTSRGVETQAQVGPPALSRAGDPAHPGSLFRQLISEEDDSNAPSLFKLGWLSSMTK
uniref:Conserved oligomeric Golgi complex subunit 1 n=1 Tax=Castor canadensis TaxID=51338 RepID=A0A8C0XUN7_CASCN